MDRPDAPPTLAYQSPHAIRVEPNHSRTFCALAGLSAVFPLSLPCILLFDGPGHYPTRLDWLIIMPVACLFFATPFWITVWIMHRRPFDRPTGLSIRRMRPTTHTFLITMCAAHLAVMGLGMANIDIGRLLVHWLVVIAFAWLVLTAWPGLTKALRRVACAAILVVLAMNLSTHRCQHVTLASFFGIPVYAHGKPCGNSRQFRPIFLEPWRFRS